MHTCTTDDLLLYHYGDLSFEERLLTEAVLQQNWGLRERLRVIQEATDRLDAETLSAPAPASLQAVLDHLYEHNSSSVLSRPVGDLR